MNDLDSGASFLLVKYVDGSQDSEENEKRKQATKLNPGRQSINKTCGTKWVNLMQ